MSTLRSLLTNIIVLAIVGAGFFYVLNRPGQEAAPPAPAATTTAVQIALVGTTQSTAPSSSSATPKELPKKSSVAPVTTPKSVVSEKPPNQVERVQNPYSTPPLAAEDINAAARAALVNIVCMPRGGSLSPISGSGVFIDPRGIILTNAHVAQYVLLAQDPHVDLSCTIRTGAPAVARFVPRVLYFPVAWAEAHASEIRSPHATGTGEHDYALLIPYAGIGTTPLPTAFPYVSPDIREAIAFQSDHVLVASYPAEFVGGITAQSSLFPASSFSSIKELFTFATNSIDIVSLGGIIEAQSGSSGGAVLNAWGRLVGLIVTMSEGATTAERDLHALSLSYIDRDLNAQTGGGISAMLVGDPYAKAGVFDRVQAPVLTKLFIDHLTTR